MSAKVLVEVEDLRSLEWSAYIGSDYDEPACPVCFACRDARDAYIYGDPGGEHEETCWLAQAIGAPRFRR